MADNFDSNVAKRKPNVVRKKRPVHPWDVSGIPVDTSMAHDTTINPEHVSPVDKTASLGRTETTVDRVDIRDISLNTNNTNENSKSTVSIPKKIRRETSRKKNYLSDSINIHSNYCKLDNDISDYLFAKLSPSAQSVYLRLYRQSFGWNRNWAAESLPKLTKACNLSLQTVRKAIKELNSFGCIQKEFSDYHKATVYRIFLPSEIGLGKNRETNDTISDSARLNNASPYDTIADNTLADSDRFDIDTQNNDSTLFQKSSSPPKGLYTVIQSSYFSGSVFNILENGGELPGHISKNIISKHIANAVETIDEFYNSIGFSIVSRSLYRKSLLDYFDLIKSNFSDDDIRYAVRWTFKNSRSRPESFSLIKHTMHLAMNDFIRDLKMVSGEKELAEQKEEAIRKNIECDNRSVPRQVSSTDIATWIDIVENLKDNLHEHSFRTFIEPLKLTACNGNTVVLSAPQDSISWIRDHYIERIEAAYRDKTGENISVTIE